MTQIVPPDRLDLKQLDAFAAVMSAGSITAAARMLGRSQSVVTRLIQDLEAGLGYALLHRSGPRISPTERGVLFFEEVERLLKSFAHARESARAIGAGAPRPIEVAATPALSVSLLPASLAGLAPETLPDRVRVSALASERVMEAVVARTADFGLATLPLVDSGLDVHWIGEAPCVVVMRAGDPLGANSVVRLRDLGGRRLLTLASRLRRRIDEVLARARVPVGAVLETNASSTAMAMARAGLGIAIVEPATAHGLRMEGVTVRPLDTHIPLQIAAFSPAGKPLPPILVALNAALLQQAHALLPGFRLRGGSFEAERAEASAGDAA